MKKTLLLPLLSLTVATGSASKLSPEQAVQRLFSDSDIQLPVSTMTRGDNLQLDKTVDNIYIFSNNEGFFFLPAYDQAPPLLGYSDNSSVNNTASDILENPGLRYWLDFYNTELKALANSADSYESADDSHKSATRADRSPITPLLTTKWNQEAPYNLLCPKVNGHETVTGCVATAMAQVMKFHNYPERGNGSHSYLWRPGEEELSFDYAATPFRWDLMTDTYDDKSSESAKEAVAELMYGCGVSVNMHYEPGGSGAATTQMGISLIDIFNYSPSLWMPNRSFYGYYEWEDMIYSDLEQGLPVLYSGAGTAGGHQFICDGYSSNGFFHFNWGWGGLSDGYFLLTALNPDGLGVGGGAGGFNTSQVATLGVRPKKDGDLPVYLFYNDTGFEAETLDIEAGNDFICTGQYFNYSLSTMPSGSKLGMKFESDNKEIVKFVDGPGVEGYKPYDGRNKLQIVFPQLEDGVYNITPALYVEGKWYAVRMPIGDPSVVTVTIADGKASVENQSEATVIVKDIEAPSTIYRNHDFPMSFTVENTGDKEFYSSITPYLADTEGNLVAKSEFRPIDLMAGASELITDYVCRFSPEKNEVLDAGTYTLIFRDENGKDISKPMEINLVVTDEKTVIKISDFRIDEKEPITDPSAVKICFTISCESGVYYGSLHFRVFPGSGGYEVFNTASESIYLTEGESREITMSADMSSLKDGWYMSFIYNGSESLTGQADFHLDREASGIDAVSASMIDDNVEYYRLDGTRVYRHSLEPGIYIVRKSGKTFKLYVR